MPQSSPDQPQDPSEEGLLALIADEVEESLQLEYKAAGALQGSAGKKKEITKDVSAMANSAGGRIIYGIAEYDDVDRQHLPESLAPIDRTEFSKERLEQVINNIRPRIEGLVIFPVPLSTGETDVAYVVEVPQSSTAHQAKDHRYYKRHNFQSVPMEDHEVRDVMGRSQHPQIEVRLVFERETKQESPLAVGGPLGRRQKQRVDFYMEVWALNDGPVIAEHVVVQLRIPSNLLHPDALSNDEQGQSEVVRWCKNTHRDVVDAEFYPTTGAIPKYGPSRYDPMLPRLSRRLKRIQLHPEAPTELGQHTYRVSWTVYADEAPPHEGSREFTLEYLRRELDL